MDEGHENGQEHEETRSAAAGSLAARMAARREEAESAETELWELPGRFADIIGVEFRVLGWKTCQGISRRHQRVRDEGLRVLYVARDQLLAATVGFYEIVGDRLDRSHPLPDETWVTLARRGVENLPEDLEPRTAMSALIGLDTLIPILWQEWQEWMRERRPEVEEEVVQDFGKTG